MFLDELAVYTVSDQALKLPQVEQPQSSQSALYVLHVLVSFIQAYFFP